MLRRKPVKPNYLPWPVTWRRNFGLMPTQGQYRDLRFQNLKLDADYDRGVIKQFDLELRHVKVVVSPRKGLSISGI